MENIITNKKIKIEDSITIEDLRHDVQELYYLKDFARKSESHIGVFTVMSGRNIDEALRKKASFIMGGPTLSTWIQQDNKYYKRFKKARYVDIYDKDGNERVLIGLIGHIDDTQIIIHPVEQSWIHPIVAHDFKDWDLIYIYPK